MLTSAARMTPIDRLTPGDHRPGAPIDWATPIDRSRLFICESITPLRYTPVWAELGAEHRLRYNQLTGMMASELILLLETECLGATLAAVTATGDEALAAAVGRFAADEQRHAATWRRLNRLSEPAWYATTDYVLCQPSAAVRTLARAIARHPLACPAVFWIQLSQEERSVEISRRCLRVPADRIEPRYAAAYREHLRDEVRHVQIDCHLIERFYARRSAAVRWLTAALVRPLLGTVFLRPLRSTVRVATVLAGEFPELVPLVPRIRRELAALAAADDYHRMMYSRDSTPTTFAWFDRFTEFHAMRRVLRAYEPEPAGRTT